MAEFTVKEVLDAIRAGNKPKIKDFYYTIANYGVTNILDGYLKSVPKVKGGCALGQAALILGVDASRLDSALGFTGISIPDAGGYKRLLNTYIRNENDLTNATLKEIAQGVEEHLTDVDLQKIIYV